MVKDMKIEVEIPENTTIKIDDRMITVSGKEGSVTKEIKTRLLSFKVDGNKIILDSVDDRKKSIAQTKTIERIIGNMLSGVNKKYTYELSIVYSHFPMTVKVQGNEFLINNFSGEKKVRKVKLPNNLDIKIKGKSVTITSVDKSEAGRIAGLIEKNTIVRNRDRRVYQDGIYIVKKGVQDDQ